MDSRPTERVAVSRTAFKAVEMAPSPIGVTAFRRQERVVLQWNLDVSDLTHGSVDTPMELGPG